MYIDDKTVVVCLNNIRFNIECDSKELASKVYKKYKNYFVEDISFDSLVNINISFSMDKNNYNSLYHLLSKTEVDSFLRPNIVKYKINGEDVFFANDSIVLDNGNDNYTVVSEKNIYGPYYVMLECMSRILEEYGTYLFHGNSYGIEDLSLVTIRESGSGKTSLMSKLFQLEELKKSFLSNDRLLLSQDRSMYFPIDINIDRDIIRFDSHLSKYFNYEDKKQLIKPREIPSIYPNMEYRSSNPNQMIIIPKIDFDNKTSISLVNASSEEARFVLKRNMFSINDRECERDFWIRKPTLIEQERFSESSKLINQIIDNYGVYILRYGCDTNGSQIYEKILKSR